MAFAPRRGARNIGRFLRAERRTLRQGLVALILGTIAAFVAGVWLGSITDTLERLPGLFILIPAALSMRGTIFGSMGARLATSTHAGLFEVTRDRGGVLYREMFVAVVLTLSSSLYLAVLAKLSAIAFGLPSMSVFDFITISVLGGMVDSVIILALTLWLAVTSFRRGYDLDAVSTPIVTAVADMTTVPVIFAVSFIARLHALSVSIAIVCIVIGLYAAIRGGLTDLRPARRILFEMTLVILLTPLLDILAGTVVEARLDRFVAFPGLLVLVPPFVAGAGSLGGILCSRLSSKLHLGLVGTRALPDRAALPDAGLAMSFSVVVFALTGLLGLGFSVVASKAYPGAATMILGTLVAGLVATAIAIVFSYYIAILTSRRGLDPDNHSVPIITSVMDLLGVFTFLFVFSLFGVALHG
jgi:mgtE-like transporter